MGKPPTIYGKFQISAQKIKDADDCEMLICAIRIKFREELVEKNAKYIPRPESFLAKPAHTFTCGVLFGT